MLDYIIKDLDERISSHKIAYFSLYSPWSHLYVMFPTNTSYIYTLFIYPFILRDNLVPSLYIQKLVCELIICFPIVLFLLIFFLLVSHS